MTEAELFERLATGGSVGVAPELLGCWFVSEVGGDLVKLRITEVEAYGGGADPASHAHRGRTDRNQSMFLAGGHLYVYRSYGIHWCANVVTGAAGVGQAVLLRAGQVTEGHDIAVARRGRAARLAEGPGNLTQALGISGHHDGAWLSEGEIRLEPRREAVPYAATPRVGITKAVDKPWRFVELPG